jgi:Glycosyltransferase WbsX
MKPKTRNRLCAFAAVTILSGASAMAQQPLVGAIRWDAWQDQSTVQETVEKTLSPHKWHYRLPFFAKITGEDQVSFADGNTQATMDQEIAYAHQAGLDYWAFVTYPADIGMSNGLKLYLASAHKGDIHFALSLQGGWLTREEWAPQVQRYVKYFKDANYQKVMDNRPLVYLYDVGNMVGGRFADWTAARAALDQLRQATVDAGLGQPYLVIQGWNPAQDKATAEKLGAEAIGAYARSGGTDQGLPYADLPRQLHTYWDNQKATGAQVVPLVSSGWDRRPRVEHPVPWEPGPGSAEHFLPLAPQELTDHLTDAIKWVTANRTAAPAKVILIYAWNEHDEGGWLCPTRKPDGTPDTNRVDAIHQAIATFAAPR